MASQTDSERSIGFVATEDENERNRTQAQQQHQQIQQAISNEKLDDQLTHVCCLLLYCTTHRRLAIRRNGIRGQFLPLIRHNGNESWTNLALVLLKRLISRLVRDIRLNSHPTLSPAQIGNNNSKTSTFMKTSDADNSITTASNDHERSKQQNTSSNRMNYNCLCHIMTTAINWVGEKELLASETKLWGPEIEQFYQRLQCSDSEKFELMKNYADCSVRNTFKRLRTKNEFRSERRMLYEGKYVKLAMIRLYNEFIVHCFPSRYMNYYSFRVFMLTRIGWPGNDEPYLISLFKSFNIKQNGYLSFDELLIGLAAIDTLTPHQQDPCLSVRLSYIFRFYAPDGTNKLPLVDLSNMNADIIAQNRDCDLVKTQGKTKLWNDLGNYFTNAISQQDAPRLTLESFIAVARGSKIFCQLTSVVLRAPFNLLLVISTKFDYRPLNGSVSINNVNNGGNSKTLVNMIVRFKHNEQCTLCRRIKFRISARLTRINTDGRFVTVNYQTIQSTNKLDLDDKTNEQELEKEEKIPFAQEQTDEDTNLYSLAKDLIERITMFGIQTFGLKSAKNGEECQTNKWWNFESHTKQMESIKPIVNYWIKRGFGPKILSVNGTCFILSSLHGNLRDLLVYGRSLWRSMPNYTMGTFIILGNVIGPSNHWSLECLVMILCLKLLAPNQFILLRGSHDTLNGLQQQNVNPEDQNETEFYNHLTDVINQLPLGVVIEDRVFCSTSGFPNTELKSIRGINYILDPVLPKPMNIKCAKDILYGKMFENEVNNSDHIPSTSTNMNETAFRRFYRSNRLGGMIRNHCQTKTVTDCSFYFNNRAISLCSSSLNQLQQSSNSIMAINAAVVCNEQIRLIRIDTINKQPN
ncbi:hypothetical protein BLOT_006942 [Blomia tropicalis]|nr:hypothetical protein BLOT_006942 [Blomia tropicalis]